MVKRISMSFTVSLLVMLCGCTLRGFQPPPFAYDSFVDKDGVKIVKEEAIKKMTECGIDRPDVGRASSDKTENDIALRDECLFSKGLFNGTGWGGICADPERRARLPACTNAPIRPRYR